jgi:hypothetical protein
LWLVLAAGYVAILGYKIVKGSQKRHPS